MMTPEQVLASLETVGGQRLPQATDRTQAAARRDRSLVQFTQSLNNDEGEQVTSFYCTVPQTLLLFNGEPTRDCLRIEADTILGRLTTGGRSPREVVDHLFLAAYGRKASDREFEQLGKQVRGTDPARAYQDLLWSLVNSNEFLFVY